MKTKIECSTQFDITATGVLGQYKENRKIQNQYDSSMIQGRMAWTKARNQQRNWETMNQIISLRCLPENITTSHRRGNQWCFEFEVDNPSALSEQPNDLVFLLQDADGVPMITGLEETTGIDFVIHTLGSDPNTQFQAANDKYHIGELDLE